MYVILHSLIFLCYITVELLPHNPIYFAGRDVAFTCNAQSAIEVRWYFNETSQHSFRVIFSAIVGVGILRIEQIPASYNGTLVQCEAIYFGTSSWSRMRSIKIQGIMNFIIMV